MKQATSDWKHLWETWDLRLAILFSLLLQIILIFSAPLRKRMSKSYVLVPMWLAYLLADATAIFAAGLIIRGQGYTYGPFANPDLVAFWTPFLLVHLGGPDTITAFALEDDELWLRHLLGLGFPCWAVVYASFQSFPKTELRVSTLLIFVVGVIKYIERTRALYLASSRTLKDSLLLPPDPGPDYAKLMDEYTSRVEADPEVRIKTSPDQTEDGVDRCPKGRCALSELEVVQHAYDFLEYLKVLVADLVLGFPERSQSRDFFINRTERDAFRVLEVELNFLYDILYTKASVVQGMLGFLVRILLFILTFSSLGLFYFMEKKEFKKLDIVITYTLLLGAIALDLISFVMVLYSDWTAAALTKSDHPNWGSKILRKFLPLDRKLHLRWSERLSQYNLLDYCLHPRSKWWEKTVGFFGLTNMLDGMKYVETVEFTNDLRNLIFSELKMKSELGDEMETVKEIYSAKGDWTLRFESHTELLRWIAEVEFDKSLLLWHIATELCFNTDESSTWTNNGGATATNPNSDDNKEIRNMSKRLSDYMLYLLIVKPSLLSTLVGIGQTRFRDTCAEAKRFFCGRKINKPKNCCLDIFTFCKWCFWKKCCCKGENGPAELKIKACKSVLAVNTTFEPATIKGDISKSVLFDGCILAKELKNIKDERLMWKIISQVWVELLSYAACRCRANIHAAELSKGGQLITLVWLSMAHLGLREHFLMRKGAVRAELVSGEELN